MYWDKFTKTSTGNYICQAKNKETNQNETLHYILNAVEPIRPTINGSNFDNGTKWNVKLSQAFNLTCDFSGVPRPKLTWYKYENDDERKPLKIDEAKHMSLENDEKIVCINYAKDEDEGKYECEAKYGQFSDQRSVTIKISKKSTF